MKILSSPAKSTNVPRKFPIRILLVPIFVVVIFSACIQIFRPIVAKKIAAEIASTPNSGSIPSAGITTQQNKTDASRINVAIGEKNQTAEEQARACRTEADLRALPSYSTYFYSRPREHDFPGIDYKAWGMEAVRDNYAFQVMVPCMTNLGWDWNRQSAVIAKFHAKFDALKNEEAARLLLHIAQRAQANSSPEPPYFTNVQLTNGVSIDIPSHWTVLSQDSRKTIMAAGEALSENAGIANSGGKRKNLLAVSAVPSPTGATIRVNVSTPPEYTQADLAKISTDGLEQLRTGFLVVSKQLEASGGPKIIEIPVPRVERLGNNLAVVMSYKRQGANGSSPWQVNQYKVPLSDRLIEITLSHRAEDGMVWKPILEKVKNSVRLQ